MAAVSIAGVPGATSGLRDVSLEIGESELLTLLGRSCCGKSILLRIFAGLEVRSAGGRGLMPERLDVAMVPQSCTLYPHLTVTANMALRLRMWRPSAWQRLTLSRRCLLGTAAASVDIHREVMLTAAIDANRCTSTSLMRTFRNSSPGRRCGRSSDS